MDRREGRMRPVECVDIVVQGNSLAVRTAAVAVRTSHGAVRAARVLYESKCQEWKFDSKHWLLPSP